MNLLTAFGYVFKADTSDLDKNIDKAEKKSQDLAKSLGASEKAAVNLSESFRGVIAGGVAALASAFAVGAIIASAKAASEYATELGKVADELRMDVAELDATGQAFKRLGGSVEGTQAMLGKFREGLLEFRRTGGGEFAMVMNSIGIHMRDAAGHIKQPVDMLPQLADKMSKLSELRQIRLAEKLGIDDQTMRVLRQGRDAVEAMIAKQKELGTVTAKDVEVARTYQRAQDDLAMITRRLSLDTAQRLLPVLTWMVERMEKIALWIRNNKDLVTGFFIGLASIITLAYLPAVLAATAATLLWLAPFILIGGAIAAVAAAIALVYEDITVFLEGGDSLIGKFIAKWPALGEAIKAIIGVLQFVQAAFVMFARYVWDVITEGPTKAFENLRERGGAALEKLVSMWPGLGTAAQTVGNVIKGVADGVISAWEAVVSFITRAVGKIMDVASAIKGAAGTVAGWFGAGTPTTPAAANPNVAANAALMARGAQVMPPKTGTPLATTSSQAISNTRTTNASKTTQVTVDRVEVNTQATDADGIAAHIGTALSSSVKQAADQFDDGVAY